MNRLRKKLAFVLALLFMLSSSIIVYASDITDEDIGDGGSLSSDDIIQSDESQTDDGSEIASEENIVLYEFDGGNPSADGIEDASDENTLVVHTDDIDFIDGAVEESKGLSFDFTDAFDLATANSPEPSLADGTWKDYGLYYDYNYDTSSAAQWGAWGGNANLSGQKYPDTNNNDVCNAFGLYTDGDNVKLYISYAGLFYAMGNGNDYNFMFNGSGYNGAESAKFRVVLDDGTDLSAAHLDPGTYNLKIYHGDHSISGYVADAYGTIVVKPNNAYNEMEVVIPISAMKEQNDNINTDVIQSIAFTTPNLMRGQVECAGTSTGSGLGMILAFLMSGLGACISIGKFGFLS